MVDALILTEAERFHAGNVAMKGLDALGFDSIREFNSLVTRRALRSGETNG